MGLVAGKIRIALLAMLLVVGAVVVAVFLGLAGVPSVDAVENRFLGVNETATVIGTEIMVHNPNPVGASLGGVTVNYTVDLSDVRLASGMKRGINISSGNATLKLRTVMANERIPQWWVTHIRNGEQSTLRVHATIKAATLGRSVSFEAVDRPVTTDILSAFNSTETRPVNANSPLVDDPVLYVNETGAWWGDVSSRRTPLRTAFVVYNPKPVPYTVTEIGYTIRMNDIVVGDGATERVYAIPPRTERTVQATTDIDNTKLNEWWVSHLENDQVTQLQIDFYAVVELPTGQTIRVPLDGLTYDETIETDIFGTKNETGASTAGGATPTDAPTRTTSTDGSGTPTPTAAGATPTQSQTPSDGSSPTATATPEETPTPTDGGPLPLAIDG